MSHFHFTYVTTNDRGHYYVGRHSTTDLDDGYLGSGNWVRHSLKKGRKLTKQILEFHPTEVDLRIAEEKLLEEHVGQPNCKNQNRSSVGFSTGENNPAHSEKELLRRRTQNWTMTPEGRLWISQNNPSYREDVRQKQRDAALKNPSFTGMWISGESHHTKSEAWKEDFKLKNPMNNPESREKLSVKAKEQVKTTSFVLNNPEVRKKAVEGSRRFRLENPDWAKAKNAKLKGRKHPRVACPHCGTEGGGGVMKKYHFERCRRLNKQETKDL